MATRFNCNDAADRLKLAAELMDKSMNWSSSPEGQDYWADVNTRLLARAEEARKQGHGTSYYMAKAADLVIGGITWADQPEGSSYWADVHSKLEKLAKTQQSFAGTPASNTSKTTTAEAAPADSLASIRARLAAVKKGQQDSA